MVPNSYTLVDNFQWSKGQHNLTFGIQMQWLQDNTSSQSSPSGIYTQAFAGISTANYVGNTLNSTATGYSYASFLLGAVNAGATSVPLFTETAGRFRPISPYFQDDWKVRPNLTLNLGLRWDYLPPYHEGQDRWSFFNPNATNPLTGTPWRASVRRQSWLRHQLPVPYPGPNLLEELGTAYRSRVGS